MINFKGTLIASKNNLISIENRGLKYGDGLFETIKVIGREIVFLEDHYFRLMASMRMLRMEIPMSFNLEFFKNEILKTVEANKLVNARVRFSVFRADGGLYLPKTNDIDFYIETNQLTENIETIENLDLYKDFWLPKGLLSNLKTTNRLINVLASIYCNENGYDNCILLNADKHIAEVTNANIFLVFDNVIKTPALSEGCIKGIVRKKTIEILEKSTKYKVEETSISPFELQKADEVFITNAIQGVQLVKAYRKTTYKTEIGSYLRRKVNELI